MAERRVRARYILWRTKHKPRLLTLCHSWGANAYYRLFFVKVEHHRHAMKFSSIIVRETAQLISKPFHLTLRWSMGPSGKKAKSTELFRHCIFNPVSCVRGAKIISVCFLWEINFWYSWRAVYSMNAKLIASGLSWSYKKKKIEKIMLLVTRSSFSFIGDAGQKTPWNQFVIFAVQGPWYPKTKALAVWTLLP